LQLTVIRSRRHMGGRWAPLRNSSGRQKALFTCMRRRPSLREGGQVFRRCLAPQGRDWTKKPPRAESVAADSPDSAPHWQHPWAGRARYPYSKLGLVEGVPLAKVLRFPSGANSWIALGTSLSPESTTKTLPACQRPEPMVGQTGGENAWRSVSGGSNKPRMPVE
jgi:hypothetical protein